MKIKLLISIFMMVLFSTRLSYANTIYINLYNNGSSEFEATNFTFPSNWAVNVPSHIDAYHSYPLSVTGSVSNQSSLGTVTYQGINSNKSFTIGVLFDKNGNVQGGPSCSSKTIMCVVQGTGVSWRIDLNY
jgi:hypothetical protein